MSETSWKPEGRLNLNTLALILTIIVATAGAVVSVWAQIAGAEDVARQEASQARDEAQSMVERHHTQVKDTFATREDVAGIKTEVRLLTAKIDTLIERLERRHTRSRH